ncbi:aminotransferase class I/II-fold pyridoxal phosphate-dependent enzyme [[Limnothrix rosea] IAM M-220]|uniref:aminotransferase class I/II-fold pyridoxal phosphate-dependent enzyme n=1 Tax=[Limnothrix rosea] IAM M-220 TaxID=454133 RepID=UPI00095C1F3C|nr:aminotransferase class I/II-fold pyridoxal phosphate-dependent enzyme [[Limnothrix rosea] IAM M-220]OKH14239.1 lysine decarboxylase [[Limnothrix rosea] IAM M-220]
MTPLFSKLLELSQKKHAPFYAPGHKLGRGIFHGLTSAWGTAIFRADLPELPDLDNLFAPEGVIEEAQDLAAQTFGADRTCFLVNGSTCGLIASILATVGDGEKILLPRNIHQSAIAGLIHSGAMPVFVDPPYDPQWDLNYGLTPDAVAEALKLHPDIQAVVILSPTYQGVCPDVGAIAEITHTRNVPLIVDEAHGSHFKFHPDLPPTALELGADLVIQSTHKTLGAMTQASMLHVQGSRISHQKISRALQLVESTSPSYLLLASLDAAREQMATDGKSLWGETLELTNFARQELKKISGIKVFDFKHQSGFKYFDTTRLTIDVTNLGFTGYEADEILHKELNVTCELPLEKTLTFILTFGNTKADINQLIDAVKKLGDRPPSQPYQPKTNPHKQQTIHHLPKLTPRQAFYTDNFAIPLEKSSGKTCGELICPYPPGIPILMPGEIITKDKLTRLQNTLNLGGIITGITDPTLKNIQIIDHD